MTTRILPPHEWARIAQTGALVDKRWESLATKGCVISVEIWTRIIALAFVLRADGEGAPHVDGLWIDPGYRRHISVGRALHRGIKYAVDQLGGGLIPIDAAHGWMTRPERRAHGIEL